MEDRENEELIRSVVQGGTIARGVACTLVTAGEWFAMRPLADGRFEVSVRPEGVRFLPVACFPPVSPTKSGAEPAGTDCLVQ